MNKPYYGPICSVLICLPSVGNFCEHVVKSKCLGVSGGMHAVRFQHSGAGDTGPNYTGSKTSPIVIRRNVSSEGNFQVTHCRLITKGHSACKFVQRLFLLLIFSFFPRQLVVRHLCNAMIYIEKIE